MQQWHKYRQINGTDNKNIGRELNFCHKEITIKLITGEAQINTETLGFPGGSGVKNLPANAGDVVRSLGQEDPLE